MMHDHDHTELKAKLKEMHDLFHEVLELADCCCDEDDCDVVEDMPVVDDETK